MTVDGVLAARLRAQVSNLGRVVERAGELLAKADAQGDQDYLDGVALNLHGFYTGAERIFETVAREVDGSLPTGAEWHRDLLTQMSVEIAGVRPAVIDRDSRNCLEEYRGFRYVVRNVYTFSLRPARVRELGSGLRACHTALARGVGAFCDFLEGLGSG